MTKKEKSDYSKVRDCFTEVGIDFRPLWAPDLEGVHILLMGCVFEFDKKLRFVMQDSCNIDESNAYGIEEEE